MISEKKEVVRWHIFNEGFNEGMEKNRRTIGVDKDGRIFVSPEIMFVITDENNIKFLKWHYEFFKDEILMFENHPFICIQDTESQLDFMPDSMRKRVSFVCNRVRNIVLPFYEKETFTDTIETSINWYTFKDLYNENIPKHFRTIGIDSKNRIFCSIDCLIGNEVNPINKELLKKIHKKLGEKTIDFMETFFINIDDFERKINYLKSDSDFMDRARKQVKSIRDVAHRIIEDYNESHH